MSKEKINNMIDNIMDKDNIGAESEFKSVMSDKVGQKLEDERRIVSKDMITKHIHNQRQTMMRFDNLYSTIIEKDEHKKTTEYKKLSPKMKKSVDLIFQQMDAKPSDFINSFEKTINNAVKKFKVSKDELMGYFEKEMLTIGK